MKDENEELPVELQKLTLAERWQAYRLRMTHSLYLDDNNTKLKLWGYLPLAGASLFCFTLVRLIYLLTPPKFMDPAWELQTLAASGELMASLYLGAVLFFFLPAGDIKLWKLACFNYASWLVCVIGVICLLVLPLAIFDAQRVYNIMNEGFINAWNEREDRWLAYREAILDASSEREEAQLARALDLQGEYIKAIEPGLFPKERKDWLLKRARQQFEAGQAEVGFKNHQENWKLFWMTLRILITYMITSLFYIFLFIKTRWIRNLFREFKAE